MAVPTIASGALRKMLGYAESIGITRAIALAELGVDAATLDDPDARVPLANVHAAWTKLVAQAPAADAQFAGIAHNPGDYGLVGFVVMTSATVDEALGQFIRYIGLYTDEPRFSREGAVVRMVFRHHFDDSVGLRLTMESAFIELVHAARLLTRTHVRPREVRFAHPAPADTTSHAGFFGIPVEFGADAYELVFRDEDLALPLALADPGLGAFLRDAANQALSGREVDTSSIVDRARSIVAEQLARRVPSLDDVAAVLATTPRTLRRRLADAGTSFRELLDDTRAELARSYVRDRRRPLAEVAFMIGFSEPSAFHRAFKRWTGTTPAEWRARRG